MHVESSWCRSGPAPAVIVIYNPTAGRRRAQMLWRVLDILVHAGLRLQLAETQHAGHATQLAREAAARGARLVVAAGGDGTIADVANGLSGSRARMGVIPLGTANVLAHELALPFRPHAVASALAFGRTRTLWPGVAHGPRGDRLFVQMVGVGLDAEVVHRLPLPMKRLLGRGAYVLQTVRELARYGYPVIHMRVDGADMTAVSAIVSKGRLYAGRYTLAPAAMPTEPGFTLALFDHGGPGAAAMYAAALPFNLLPFAPGVRLLRVSRVEFHGNQGIAVQADGDPVGTTPLHVYDAAAPIQVVVAG